MRTLCAAQSHSALIHLTKETTTMNKQLEIKNPYRTDNERERLAHEAFEYATTAKDFGIRSRRAVSYITHYGWDSV